MPVKFLGSCSGCGDVLVDPATTVRHEVCSGCGDARYIPPVKYHTYSVKFRGHVETVRASSHVNAVKRVIKHRYCDIWLNKCTDLRSHIGDGTYTVMKKRVVLYNDILVVQQ
jgi:hypothetical protein